MKFELAHTTIRAGIVGAVVIWTLGLMLGLINGLFAPSLTSLQCLLTTLSLPIAIATPFMVGAYSVMLGRWSGRPAGNNAQDAVDGGIAGAIAGLLSAVLTSLVSLLIALTGNDVAGAVMSTLDAGIGSACYNLIGGAVLAAIGGLMYRPLIER